MAYHVGDVPLHDLVIEPALTDFEDYDTASAVLTSPAGDDHDLDATVDEAQVLVAWPPAPSILDVGGEYALRVTLHSGTNAQRLPLMGVIVQDDSDGWHTLDSVREVWADAPENDRWLYELLVVAKNDVIAYAPALAEDALPPEHYRRAQQMHARDIWTAGDVSPAGDFGEGSFTAQPHPLDWMIKQILRPKNPRPVVR